MCLILDANRFGEALSTPPNPDYRPIIDWLTGSNSAGLVVFGGTKFLQEKALRARGLCISDDEHLVALARKSGARVFGTEDAALFKDVRNRALLSAPRGRVYRTKDHVALLCHNARCQRPSRRTR